MLVASAPRSLFHGRSPLAILATALLLLLLTLLIWESRSGWLRLGQAQVQTQSTSGSAASPTGRLVNQSAQPSSDSSGCTSPGKGAAAAGLCVLRGARYVPSHLEEVWFRNARSWEPEYCKHMAQFKDQIDMMLTITSEVMAGPSLTIYSNSSSNRLLAKQLFSKYVYTFDCPGDVNAGTRSRDSGTDVTISREELVRLTGSDLSRVHGPSSQTASSAAIASNGRHLRLLAAAEVGSTTSSTAARTRSLSSSDVGRGSNSDLSVEVHSWIEPLFGALRYPHALCPALYNGTGAVEALLSRGYLVVGSAWDPAHHRAIPWGGHRKHQQGQGPSSRHGESGGTGDAAQGASAGIVTPASGASIVLNGNTASVTSMARSPINIYFDLGASTWAEGSGGPSQQWIVESYKRRGIEFDRALLWEAVPHKPEAIFHRIPKDLWHAYQYFNWPAVADPKDPSNPLNILKRIAQPQDFVVFKLDIDNNPIEEAFIKQILGDLKVHGLIDEMFFEHHVNFKPMVVYWASSIAPKRYINDSYRLFSKLRHMGIRMHGWP